jgi:hypothetical protein
MEPSVYGLILYYNINNNVNINSNNLEYSHKEPEDNKAKTGNKDFYCNNNKELRALRALVSSLGRGM